MEKIGEGAEAVIYRDGSQVIKDRIRKAYRTPEIDGPLRRQRTKREAKVLEKLSLLGFSCPKLEKADTHTLFMQYMEGDVLRDVLYKDPLGLGREVGRKVGLMHENDIIHGDLTTSNMILNARVSFIDFGLSNFSKKVEDKAVDLHLLRQALESKHHTFWEECFEAVINGYKKSCSNADDVLKRLELVELRGRNKH